MKIVGMILAAAMCSCAVVETTAPDGTKTKATVPHAETWGAVAGGVAIAIAGQAQRVEAEK